MILFRQKSLLTYLKKHETTQPKGGFVINFTKYFNSKTVGFVSSNYREVFV